MIFRVLRRRWWAILLVGFSAAVLAFAVSFLLPLRYRSTTTFHPDQAKRPGAAINLPGVLDASAFSLFQQERSPEYLVRLIRSRTLLNEAAASEFLGNGLVEYYGTEDEKDSLGAAAKKLGEDISLSVDRLPGIIRLDVEMKEPALAQEVAARVLELTGTLNAELRQALDKSRADFLEERLVEASGRLEGAEEELRGFLQKNRRLDSPVLLFEQKRLERRVNLAQELYLQLSREARTVEIEALDDLTRITVIDPPSLPVKPSSPRRIFLALVSFLAGSALAFCCFLRPIFGS